MKKIFDLDSPFVHVLNRFTDILVLNALFLLTCLPVFTIGAAWTALYSVALKMVRGEEAYIAKSYFKAMKQNFRQATVMGAGMGGMCLVLYFDFHIMQQSGGQMSGPVQKLLAGICLVFFMLALYVFPMLARYENTIWNTLNNAFITAVQHIPCTLAMAAISAGSVAVTFFSIRTAVYGIPFWLLGGFALIACVNAWFLRRVFDRYE